MQPRNHQDIRQSSHDFQPSPSEAYDYSNIQYHLSVGSSQIATLATEASIIAAHCSDGTFESEEMSSETVGLIKEVSLGAGFLMGIIAWAVYVKRKIRTKLKLQNNQLTLNDVNKDKINRWYDRYNAASLYGNYVAETIAYCIPLPFPPLINLVKLGLSSGLGFIFGVFAILFIPSISKEENTPFKVGRDGWTKYSKLGGVIGGFVGAAIASAVLIFCHVPMDISACIALGSSVGGVAGFLGISAFVPVINKIRHALDPATEEADKNSKFKTNYTYSGATFGASLGSVVGLLVGTFVPFPGSQSICSALGAGIGAVVGAAVFTIAGPIITDIIDKKNECSNRWESDARFSSTLGKECGNTLSNALQTDKNTQAIAAQSGSIIAFMVGGIYDLYQNYRYSHATEEEKRKMKLNEPLLSWTSRLMLFGGLGSAVGGLLGSIAGPIGMAIGASVGYIIGGAIGIAFGDRICRWVLNKVTTMIQKYYNLDDHPPTEHGKDPNLSPKQSKVATDTPAVVTLPTPQATTTQTLTTLSNISATTNQTIMPATEHPILTESISSQIGLFAPVKPRPSYKTSENIDIPRVKRKPNQHYHFEQSVGSPPDEHPYFNTTDCKYSGMRQGQ